MGSSQTKLGKLAIGAADPVDTFLRFGSFDPGVRKDLRRANGTAGTFFNDANLVRHSRTSVTPSYSGEPTAAELEAILRWSFGAPVGSPALVFSPPNDVTLRNIHWKPVAGEPFFLSGCGVDTLTMGAASGEPLAVGCDIVGTDADDTRADFPALSPDVVTSPFMLSDLTAAGGVFSLGGSTRQPSAFSIRIQNMIDRTRFLASLTLTRVQKMDMAFNVTLTVPSGDNPSLWSAGMAGVSLVATFKNVVNGAELTITAGHIKFAAQSPQHAPGGEGMLNIDGECYRTGGTGYPMQVTLTQGS